MDDTTTLHTTDWAARLAADCRAAQQHILITTLSFLPPLSSTPGLWPSLYRAWIDAAARGVAVHLITPTPTPIHPATKRNAHAAERAHRDGLHVILLPGARLLHAKTALIDDEIAWIGSGNMTAAAAHHNIEVYVRTEAPQIIDSLHTAWRSFL